MARTQEGGQVTRGLGNMSLLSGCAAPSGHELRVSALSVRYAETVAVENVDFATQCGRCVALVGPNGAGKSSLMKSLVGLVTPSSGESLWRGQPLSSANSDIAYLAQRSQVDWQFPLTVRGLVEMGRYPHVGWWRRFKPQDDEVVDEALETMRLTDLAGRQISALSGGQQQRVALARALVQKPKLLGSLQILLKDLM